MRSLYDGEGSGDVARRFELLGTSRVCGSVSDFLHTALCKIAYLQRCRQRFHLFSVRLPAS